MSLINNKIHVAIASDISVWLINTTDTAIPLRCGEVFGFGTGQASEVPTGGAWFQSCKSNHEQLSSTKSNTYNLFAASLCQPCQVQPGPTLQWRPHSSSPATWIWWPLLRPEQSRRCLSRTSFAMCAGPLGSLPSILLNIRWCRKLRTFFFSYFSFIQE